MKAMLVDENRNLVWSDVDDPVMKEDELRVDIQAAALNRADLLQRQGTYPSPPGCPPWMGLEVSGVIRGIGPVAARESDWPMWPGAWKKKAGLRSTGRCRSKRRKRHTPSW
jgi:NADPH:quinone reductase-like Zn-dependent oxidoreductase